MPIMQNEMLVPFSDLRYLSVECGQCHTEVTVDLSEKWDVSQCPVCMRRTEDALRGHLQALSIAYGQLPKLSSYKVSFRIKSAL